MSGSRSPLPPPSESGAVLCQCGAWPAPYVCSDGMRMCGDCWEKTQ